MMLTTGQCRWSYNFVQQRKLSLHQATHVNVAFYTVLLSSAISVNKSQRRGVHRSPWHMCICCGCGCIYPSPDPKKYVHIELYTIPGISDGRTSPGALLWWLLQAGQLQPERPSPPSTRAVPREQTFSDSVYRLYTTVTNYYQLAVTVSGPMGRLFSYVLFYSCSLYSFRETACIKNI